MSRTLGWIFSVSGLRGRCLRRQERVGGYFLCQDCLEDVFGVMNAWMDIFCVRIAWKMSPALGTLGERLHYC